MKCKAVKHMPRFGILISAVAMITLCIVASLYLESWFIGSVFAGLASFVMIFAWLMGAYLPYAKVTYEIGERGVTLFKSDRSILIPFEEIKRVKKHGFGIIIRCRNGLRFDLRPDEQQLEFYDLIRHNINHISGAE